MPRTKYHAKLEAERKAKANPNPNEDVSIMTTNETNSNGQLTTANLNKLASALGEQYQPDTDTIEDLLFSDKPIAGSLLNLAKLLGANKDNLAALLVADSLEGKGEITKLLRLISDEIKDKELQAKQRQLELEKQHLLQQVKELDNQLNCLAERIF